jgi:2-keto-4-pentenoate hydratase/2-oxohepta-3-ene-1,7-dioic acid hydratase in catechol pathway
VQLGGHDELGVDGPVHRFCDARGMVGHEGAVPFPAGEGRPCFELGIAALLREDLEGAGSAEATRAILGYAILNGWSGRDEDARAGTRRVPAQLGPVLVTPGEVGDVAALKAQVRVDGTTAATPGMGGWSLSLAESIAWVSRWHKLRAGDVIGAGCARGGRGDVAYGATVELHVEKLGKLAGRAVRRGA